MFRHATCGKCETPFLKKFETDEGISFVFFIEIADTQNKDHDDDETVNEVRKSNNLEKLKTEVNQK